MKYNSGNAPMGVPIWGCAYSTNDSEKTMGLIKEPVLGIIKREGLRVYFYELKKNGELKTSGRVYSSSRAYADTLEESIEVYNQKVDNQIKLLQGLIDKCAEDKINGGIQDEIYK